MLRQELNKELDDILEKLLVLAQSSLDKEETEEIFPFSLAMKDDGGFLGPLVFVVQGNQDLEQAVYKNVRDALKKDGADKFIAVGVCFDVKISDGNGGKLDAFLIGLEHRDGTSLNFYAPYDKPTGKKGVINYESMSVSKRTPTIITG